MRISDWSSDVCSSDLGDRLTDVGADLECGIAEAAVEQLDAVERGGRRDAIDFRLQRLRFSVERRAVGTGVGRVARLHCEFANALQRIGYRAERAVGGLRQRDTVVGVALSLVETADLAREAAGDREAGGVILGAVARKTDG